MYICDLLCENESDVDNVKNLVNMHGWKEHTSMISSSYLVYTVRLSFGVYRVVEWLPFEISQYIIFG